MVVADEGAGFLKKGSVVLLNFFGQALDLFSCFIEFHEGRIGAPFSLDAEEPIHKQGFDEFLIVFLQFSKHSF